MILYKDLQSNWIALNCDRKINLYQQNSDYYK